MCLALLAGCNSTKAILISATSDEPVEQYNIVLRDNDTRKVFFESAWQTTDVKGEPIDTRTTPIKVGLRLSRGGNFSMLIVGVTGMLEEGKPAASATQFFYATRLGVDGPTEVSARLLTVPAGDDQDRDLWPDGVAYLTRSPEIDALYRDRPFLLDCNDKTDMPAPGIDFTADQIFPFATERCGDTYDQNCSGDNPDDEKCVDEDGDGDVFDTDCDDKDPKRHTATAADPFPDPPNCCGYNVGKRGTAEENQNFMGDATLCPEARCGNGVDESCKGVDTTCVIDADCDGYPAAPVGNDCDDSDPAVHVGAPEPCGSTRDLNCSGAVGEGCVPCDLDGDTYQRNDSANNCPDPNNQHPGMFDCNDDDAGVFPGATAACGGSEAGTTALQRLNCALRGGCRRIYGNGVTGVARIASGAEQVGDMDCNGTPYQGCPTEACDVDGDGFAQMGGGCAGNDCDDNDPTRFPGAPDKCGDGIAQNCTADTPCGTDADGDKYTSDIDCDDMNANVHPWAAELCNGRDDDCDGIVDEGNPDGTGAPLVGAGAVLGCTDSNVGECGNQRGRCVCSLARETATYNQSDRAACPGENNDPSAPQTPKCFGAGQPKPQSCNALAPKDDDCDGRTDDPQGGAMLAVKGDACGNTNGTCTQGTVAGCDSSQTNPFYAGTSQAWYVCSPGLVYPTAEICDGRDNNCDNVIPANELDPDGDGFMSCSGCGGPPYGPGIVGCGDCGPAVSTTYPGAPEQCDNVDNNCTNGVGDDGADCAVGNPNCCLPTGCVNNMTNINHCGGCGTRCNPNATQGPFADGCAGGTCRCGGGAACSPGAGMSPGQFCNSGSCTTCNLNNKCGPNCVDCGMGSVCKGDGSGCVGCNSDADCGSGNYCRANNSCAPKKALGVACMASDCIAPGLGCSCGSNNCTDGVCCTVAMCVNGCQSCGAGGMCANVTNGTDPHNACPPMGNPECQTRTTCSNGSCNTANGTACGTDSCTNGTATTNACQSGTCTPTNMSCGAQICVGAVCGACTDSAQCGSGKYCATGGTCVNLKAQGDACTSGCLGAGCSQCSTAGGCVDGFCCNTTCSGECDRCDAASSIGSNGTCSPANAGLGGAPTCAPYTCNGVATMCPTMCDGVGTDCTGGNCCNGATCGTNNNDSHCGASCTDCTGQATNQACVSGACGCTQNSHCASNDCDMMTNLCNP